jgi:hypothetical protein
MDKRTLSGSFAQPPRMSERTRRKRSPLLTDFSRAELFSLSIF